MPKKILAGQVQGALDYKLDEQDFGATSVVAGTQLAISVSTSIESNWSLTHGRIQLVGKDKEPLDLTQDRYLGGFKKVHGTIDHRRRIIRTTPSTGMLTLLVPS